MAASRELASKEGLQSLNMRDVAKKCNVSVGSVYNYFPSKADLIAETIQDLWQSIFHIGKFPNNTNSFTDYVAWIFESVHVGIEEYPNFFTAHSMSFANADKGKAREVMEKYFHHMKTELIKALEKDNNIREAAFSDDFSKADFVGFVFTNLLNLLIKQESSCNILIEIIKRSIY
ncbi:TetR/AcrR family transcriptional regulator [Clostridium polynesiense]|uniref:TetR/AcrR family transcriptional regulator n=1 Tax=Clostridium polynesiense TaxID=1325933 RepID=UPI00241869F6|nr:TetR/AcrR family transcriptional regulator [Clostridium polynesiense]